MHHFFVPDKQVLKNTITIMGADANHLIRVLRSKTGERVLVSSMDGRAFQCEIDEIGQEEVSLRILFEQTDNHELPAKIYLFQGLPKADKMELIIQKAVELGAYEIIPVAMSRSIVRLDHKKADSKVKRWNAIAKSAAKQSMRGLVPKVMPVMGYKQAVDYARDMAVKLLPYESEKGMEDTRAKIASLDKNGSIAVFIGPEGGFDEEEVAYGRSHGFETITLGKRILRTETAGMTILSILMFHLEQAD